jgi:hypothetical protein
MSLIVVLGHPDWKITDEVAEFKKFIGGLTSEDVVVVPSLGWCTFASFLYDNGMDHGFYVCVVKSSQLRKIIDTILVPGDWVIGFETPAHRLGELQKILRYTATQRRDIGVCTICS